MSLNFNTKFVYMHYNLKITPFSDMYLSRYDSLQKRWRNSFEWCASILYPIRDILGPKVLQTVQTFRTWNIVKIYTFRWSFKRRHRVCMSTYIGQNHSILRYVSFKVWFFQKEMEGINWNDARRMYTLFEIRGVWVECRLCSTWGSRI